MTHIMEQKIQMLDGYIGRLAEVVARNDSDGANRIAMEVIGVYDAEVEGLRTELDRYGGALYRETDYIGDAQLLQAKLENYKLNLASGLYKPFQEKEAINVTQNAEQRIENSINITLEQTVEQINELPENILSSEEKEQLNGKLATLSAQKGKDKASRWKTAGSILKWLGDKTVEVGIAALPYIVEALK